MVAIRATTMNPIKALSKPVGDIMDMMSILYTVSEENLLANEPVSVLTLLKILAALCFLQNVFAVAK